MTATKNTAALLLGHLLLSIASCASQKPLITTDAKTDANLADGRSTLISSGWRFVREDVARADAVAFDDSAWSSVNLPHTWNLADGSDGGNNYYRGPGWYRKHVSISSGQLKQQLFLRFGAASLVADVYINGQHIGQHRGGFAAFCFNVTDTLHAGDNLIAVRVSNAKVPDVAPLSGDFTVFGGLYRDVELLTLDPLHISPVDDASPGVYIAQSNVSDAAATLDVTTKLQNADATAKTARVTIAVRDAAGAVIATSETRQPINAHADADARTHLELAKPHLWNGLADPYQYSVTVTVSDGTRIADTTTQPLGLRTFSIDAKTGFALNGHPYRLHGLNLHQEAAGRGWAATKADQELDYGLVRELGANAVRMAHYQHFDYEYTLCDRQGIIVWTEAPMVNEIGRDKNFPDVTKQQLRELIKQNFNHPSIAFWSLFNEVSTDDKDPRWQLLHEMNDLAHGLDPSRLTTAAISAAATHGATRWMDATAFNRYFGWYLRSADVWSPQIDKIIAQTNGLPVAPDTQPDPDAITQPTTEPATQPTTGPAPEPRAIAFSEYGAGASIHQHEIDPTRPKTSGPWHPEEYQCLVHEQAYRAMAARPDIWGTFVWAMFDFSSDGRHEGDLRGRNDKGLVTFDHQTRKDAFYFYKANWSSEPFVHITDQRFQPHPIGPADIKIYSNCDTVELFINGKSLGVVKNDLGTFVWPQVLFNSGTLHAVVTGTKAGRTFTDEVSWKIDPTAASHPAPTTTQSATPRKTPTHSPASK